MRVKGPDGIIKSLASDPAGFLASSGMVTLPGMRSTTDVDMGTQKAGDADNNNAVTAADFATLKGTFGLGQGGAGYNNRADFTGDGIVNSSDFNLLKINFGLGGAAPLGPVEPKTKGNGKVEP